MSKELAETLEQYTVEYLRSVYKPLVGKVPVVKKTDFIQMLAQALTFKSKESFWQWFDCLPPLTQTVLKRLAFTDFFPVSILEKELNESLLVKGGDYSWNNRMQLNATFALDFLTLARCGGNYSLGLPGFLRKILSAWLPAPPEADIGNCVYDSDDADPGWDNSELIADSYPLLCDAVNQMYTELTETEKDRAAKGFNKKRITELRASSGFMDFNMDPAYCPDSADLAIRFMLCMKDNKPVRPKDAYEDIRKMVTGFFGEDSLYKKSWDYPDRNFLEANVCIDHLSKKQGGYFGYNDSLPSSRKTFHKILLKIAEDGRRFDVDKLAEHIKITAQKFAFSGRDYERYFKINASCLELDGITYSAANYYDELVASGILRYYLLVKPVFKAYCYIFAALGLLEITQQVPPLALKKSKKQLPLSPYDSLHTIRITQLGLWCLGLSSEKPAKLLHEYQAIADKELLLVTVQGKSLERTIYLDKIGVKLGEDRWRVSPASFISGCESKKQIEIRIDRFKALIDPDPAPHWLELFNNAISRAGLFDFYRNDMLVYNLPQDRKITEELLRDAELKNIAFRAEGAMLVVPAKNQKKLFALLNEHGIACF